MQTDSVFSRENDDLLARLSRFLNNTPDFVTPEIIEELTRECGITAEYAFSLVLASAIGYKIDENPSHRELFEATFPHMIRELDADEYNADPYRTSISIPKRRVGRWELGEQAYRPCEAFVCDDLRISPEGRVLPQLGFFRETFYYPVVTEGGREWMLITPNEINTMREPVAAARGRVLTYGLGLGYFAFMAARKPEVESVTVVERDPAVISLFTDEILPQFPDRQKIRVVCGDAFDFARNRMSGGNYSLVFTDLWHDPSDGVPLYRRMKQFESRSPGSRFLYWIEKTLQYYL